jgi:uncharacterized ion transporter superfamily protein YfcC
MIPARTRERQRGTALPTSRESDSGNPGEAPGARRKRGFPAPVTILTLVLVIVWVAAFFIPSGQYKLDASGGPILGSFRYVDSPLDFGGRVRDLLLAPVNGMYGIKDPETGLVGPFNKGRMFGSIEVFLFILSIGGFMTVVFATGALDLGIHHLSYRFREEFRTPSGVGKSPRNEPAVCRARLMAI